MFRLWAKLFHDNRMIRDTVILMPEEGTRTHKVLKATTLAAEEFDLGIPIWLDSAVKEFRVHNRVRFYQDHFIEPISFDYLEIHVIEED